MAFDGVVIANIVYDMNRLLTGGRIYKIYQPEADELLLVVKNNKETYRLLICYQKREIDNKTSSLSQCFSSSCLFIERRKSQSYAGSKLLHAASKIY